MTDTALESSVGEKQLRFFSAFPPRVPAGSYTVEVTQHVRLGEGPSPGDLQAGTWAMHVPAPQLRLPESLVHSAYPPPGTTADADQTLPHLVLCRRTLPWERSATGVGGAVPAELPAQAPWLALLLLREGELLSGAAVLRPDVPVAELLGPAPDDPAGGVVRPVALTLDTVESPEAAEARCTVLELDAALFAGIAPLPAELGLLAHARYSRIALDGPDANPDGAGWCSIVVSNRLPGPGTNTMVLVSVEGHGDALAGRLEGAVVRLAALYAWTFVHAESADGHLDRLLASLAGAAGPLCAPVDGVQGPAATLMAAGRTAVAWDQRSGARSLMAYRGPLAPGPVALLPRPEGGAAALSAPERYRQLPELGLTDGSLAVAWELGRTAGIRNPGFATALIAWRRANHRRLHAGPQAGVHDAAVRAEPLEHLAQALRWLADRDGPPPTGAATRPILDLPVHAARIDALLDRGPWAFADALNLEEVQPIVHFVEALLRFEGLPFHVLVPDERALPDHSVRFFAVDPNWTEALVEGALSLGRASTLDRSHDVLAVDRIGALIRTRAGGGEGRDATPPRTGVLFRSAALAAWPGLQIVGFPHDPSVDDTTVKDRTDALLPIVRDAWLSESVRLVLFEGVLGRIEVRQPLESVHLGIDDLLGPEFRPGVEGVLVLASARRAKDAPEPTDAATLAEALILGTARAIFPITEAS